MNQKGFTLVELLVVVGVIALIVSFVIPSVSNTMKASMNSATREIASIVKEAYNTTVMTGKVHRMVYDFKNKQYWVEVGPANLLLDTGQTKEKEEHRKKFAKSSDKKEESPFALDKTVTRKKIALPQGVEFEDVITEQSPDPITEGKAFTHFFPHGISEQTIIHLKDTAEHHSSLIISPVVGQTHLVDRYVKGQEAFSE